MLRWADETDLSGLSVVIRVLTRGRWGGHRGGDVTVEGERESEPTEKQTRRPRQLDWCENTPGFGPRRLGFKSLLTLGESFDISEAGLN